MIEELAKRFHEAYERLAPSFGYETREDTREFDPTSANGKLMIAVCEEILPHLLKSLLPEEAQDGFLAAVADVEDYAKVMESAKGAGCIEKPLEKCPKCHKETVRAKGLHQGGGIECTNPDCDYWFCY